jgi:hypothetical protein
MRSSTQKARVLAPNPEFTPSGSLYRAASLLLARFLVRTALVARVHERMFAVSGWYRLARNRPCCLQERREEATVLNARQQPFQVQTRPKAPREGRGTGLHPAGNHQPIETRQESHWSRGKVAVVAGTQRPACHGRQGPGRRAGNESVDQAFFKNFDFSRVPCEAPPLKPCAKISQGLKIFRASYWPAAPSGR